MPFCSAHAKLGYSACTSCIQLMYDVGSFVIVMTRQIGMLCTCRAPPVGRMTGMQRCLGPPHPPSSQHTASRQHCCSCLRRHCACTAAALAAAHGLIHPLLPAHHAKAMLRGVVHGTGVVHYQSDMTKQQVCNLACILLLLDPDYKTLR